MLLRYTLLLALAAQARADDGLAFDPATFDTAVAVCANPYRYVNNRWLDSNELPPDRPVWGARFAVIDRTLAQQRTLAERAVANVTAGTAVGAEALVGAFFAAGTDTARIDAAGLASVAADLARIDAIATRKDLVAYFAYASAQGVGAPFAYSVWARPDLPGRHAVYFEQAKQGLADNARYLDDDARSRELRAAYRTYLVQLLELGGTPARRAARQADAAFAIERALAGASLSVAQLLEPENVLALRTRDELRDLAPHLDWNVLLAAHGHAAAEAISLAQPGYFRELDRQVARAPLAAWRAYLRVRLLDAMAPHLATAFAAKHFAFHGTAEQGVPAMPPRWKQVVRAFNDSVAATAMSRLYVAAHLPADAKPRALAMVADLRAAFRARIERLDWLSDAARRASLEKIDRMHAHIGYPDRWPDLGALRLDPHDHAGNMRALFRARVAIDDAKLGRAVDRDEWLIGTPHEVNARYEPLSNALYFPAPMITAPAFDPAQDAALNYSVLGVIIAHEMTHGFDASGAQFDAAGRFHDAWTADDRRRFDERSARVVARYAAFAGEPGKPVDGKLTLDENIADLGGLAIAYDALQRRLAAQPVAAIGGLTQAQRFFLRYAQIWRTKVRPDFADIARTTDPHAPAEFRALGPISDLPAFASAFGCKPGDAMVRAAKDAVGLW